MAATMPDLGRSEDRRSLESGQGQTPATRADGPSACPGDSSHERGRVGASDNPWDMQQAAKSIRVRNAGEDLLPRPGSAQRSSALGWATARVPRKRHAGCPHPTHAGAAGAVKRPVVPHAPTGEMRNRIDRQALGPDQTRGDDARPDFGRDANSSLDPHPEEACAAGRLEGRGPTSGDAVLRTHRRAKRRRSSNGDRRAKRRRSSNGYGEQATRECTEHGILRDATPSPLRAAARLLRSYGRRMVRRG